MARGIEELAEMQVTGPVQGGDMVAKPNEMPVGAAALLNKMQKKSTPGIFKLPTPDKEMPDFMKVAAEGVEEETQIASGDTYNIMAGELLREGFNPDYIKSLDPITLHQLYEETFGSVTDDMSQVDPTDWRTILKMIESGMTPAQIEEQLAMNEVKDDLHMKAAAVEEYAPEDHQLAYITPDESNILQLMGGSGETNPMTGVKTFKAMTKQERKDKETMRRASRGDTSDYVQREMQRISGSGGRPGGAYETEQAGKAYERHEERGGTPEQWIRESLGPTGRIEDVAGVKSVDYVDEPNMLEKIIGKAKDIGISSFLPYKTVMDAAGKGMANWEEGQVRDLLKTLGTDESATGWGNLLRAMQDQTTGRLSDRGKEWFEDRGDLADEVLSDPSKDNEWAGMNDEEKFKAMISKMEKGGGKQFEKNFNPDKYWKDNSPKTAQDFKDMAQAQRTGKLTMTRDNTLAIEQGRKLLEEDRPARDQGGRGGGGRAPQEEIIEDVAEVTTTDPRAGAFGVGGTMPYTHDTRTAGAQMDVPLGRRFEIDKAGKFRGGTGMSADEAYKYATLGGYSQLEPFQEYLARRRKHLGEEKPRYFDEEGNVIFSDMETT